jgi:hypothetical protein
MDDATAIVLIFAEVDATNDRATKPPAMEIKGSKLRVVVVAGEVGMVVVGGEEVAGVVIVAG